MSKIRFPRPHLLDARNRQHGPDYCINSLTREALPSSGARFACNPLLSGIEGGHNIHLRELGWLPSEPAQLNLPQANITSVLWATGYKLDLLPT